MSSTSSGKSKNVISTIRDKISFKKSTTLIAFLTAAQSLLAQNFDLKYVVEKINNTTMRVTTKIVGEDDWLPVDFLDGTKGLYDLNRNIRSYTATQPDSKTWVIEFPVQNIDSLMFGLNFTGLISAWQPTEEMTTLAKIVKNGNEYGVSPINAVYGSNQWNPSNVESGWAVGEITAVSATNNALTCNTGNGVINLSVVGNSIRYPLEVKLYDDANVLLSTLTVNSLPLTTPAYVEWKKAAKIKTKDANGMTDERSLNLTIDWLPNLVTSAWSITGTFNFCEGGSTTLTANPTNVSNPIYEWYINGVKQNSLTTATVTINQPGTIFYKVKNTNSGSGTNCYNTTDQYTSPSVSVTKNPSNPNVASDLSASATAVCEGTSVQLTELIMNANGANYGNKVVTHILPNGTIQISQLSSFPQTISPVEIGPHQYVINEIVTNPNGCYVVNLKSDTVTIDVLDKPEVTISRGQNDTLTADVVGTGPFTYQWYKNNIAIPWAINKTYPARSTGTGSYTVEVTTPTTPPCTDLSAATNVVVTGILENISDKMNKKLLIKKNFRFS